jgi:PTH1 family peptidyl-tRNA hydrolase
MVSGGGMLHRRHGPIGLACTGGMPPATFDQAKEKHIVKWIAGLGNPGRKYAMNRHNVGFMAVERFAGRHGISVNKEKFKSLYGEGIVDGVKVAVLMPQTYMNLSGEAIRAFLDFTKSTPEEGIVIYDDLDLPFGRIRLRYQGSAGGHNGMKSVIAHLGTEKFNRVRIGIDRPPAHLDVIDHVLGDFSKAERETLPAVLDKVCDALTEALAMPFDRVMAKYNA